MTRVSNPDMHLYADPDPATVARLWDDDWYGPETCHQRWHWMSTKRLASIVSLGRIALGMARAAASARRGSTPGQEAAAIETAFVLSSTSAAAVASGIYDTTLVAVARSRGIAQLPRAPVDVRIAHTRDGHLAKRDDDEGEAARRRITNRRAHELDVYGVLLTSLALVDQPQAGRYRHPPQDERLADALDGYPARAILAVYADLKLSVARRRGSRLSDQEAA